MKPQDLMHTLRSIENDNRRFYYALPALQDQGYPNLRRLPVSIRIMLESLLRHCDGKTVKESDVRAIAEWHPTKPQDLDIPFIVSRVILQDFTGVPLVVDLAAMRDAVVNLKRDPSQIGR
ncbi:MAG: aconitate hydratase, partial [Parachlamydia sp.]|nr:aconitate hydratase [Parachlamydia sp.]